MPRPGPAKTFTGVRLSPGGLKWIDDRAKQDGVTRSEMIRTMMKFASANMPKGWK